MGLPLFPDDYEGVVPHDCGEINFEFNEILQSLDRLIGPEQPADHSGDREISVLDRQTSPIVSMIVGPEEARQDVRPRAPLSPLLPIPPPLPRGPPVLPRRRESIIGKAWNKYKKVLMKRFLGGDQSAPKLSDSLVPERDDDDWYEVLSIPKACQDKETSAIQDPHVV